MQAQMNIACYIRNNSVFEQVKTVLARTGFVCEHFTSDTILLRTVRRRSFHFILVDIGIDIKDGESVFSWLNCRSGDNTPVMVLSGVQNADWVAESLNSGADDFLIRPFEAVELVARISAILRRSTSKPARRRIELGGFALDRDTSIFSYRGTPIELTPREFTMAWLFFSSPGVYISRDTIGTAIWGADSEIVNRTIEQHVYKLRKKLLFGPDRGAMIRTAYSQGYRLELYEQEPEQED